MTDYSQGKIYKIVGEDGSTYYGSTVQSLKSRIRRHPSDKKTTAYQKIISKMGWTYELIENYPCESKEQLLTREAWYIRENPCVNRIIPRRTHQEFYQDNREAILENRKVYYEHNREEILEKCKVTVKKYQLANYEKIRTQQKARECWVRTFGSRCSDNNLQRCDPSLFQ